jgi:hypothetical protein
MPNYVYVAAQDDNQIAVFTSDGETVPCSASTPAWTPTPGYHPGPLLTFQIQGWPR